MQIIQNPHHSESGRVFVYSTDRKDQEHYILIDIIERRKVMGHQQV